MSFLDKHQPVEVDRQPGSDPLLRAKQKLTAGIERQIENIRNPGKEMHRGRPISPWWFRHEDGEIYTHVRFGMRPIEFPSGKAFKIGSEDGLIPFYEELLSAIQTGELDEILDRARKIGARRPGRHGGRQRRHRGSSEC